MRAFILAAITLYQRYISPYKGFCCAYRVHTGRHSCSALGFRAIQRFGVLGGMAILRQRAYLCGVSHRRFSQPHKRPHRTQRGDCDLPCDFDFDLPNGKSCSSFNGCCDGASCDWPDKKRNKKEEERYIYIPPKGKK